jgi:class 3 adenylate cyclase/CRP-like cAMP-binding protein/tetratricopeptide (TPR) repeat protein
MTPLPGPADSDLSQMPCPACGRPNPIGFRFCGACGTSLGTVCATCGADVPAGFRFCGVCGSPVLGKNAPLEAELEERKVVTVLFADLTASTELASRLDPEDLRVLLRRFFEAMVEEIERLDGTVEKFIGDAVVAVFGVPATHEDDPERAVRAALAMQRRLTTLNEDTGDPSGVELAMRIGINTGEVVTATGIDRENLVTGEPVNVAARFQALARPGGIVVGERTYRDTRHVIAYRSLGELSVKGIERPLPAWEVTGELGAGEGSVPSPGSVGVAPLVGRDAELNLLDLLFSRTLREARSSLVTVIGPAGIGKSRLAHEFAQRIRSTRSIKIVRGRCLPYGEGLTYWPMAEILKADAGILDSDQREAILDKATSVLQGRFGADEPAMGTVQVVLSSIGAPVRPDPLEGAEPSAAKELIARSWKVYFESLASEQPVLALLEDLHWADTSLLDLVEYLAARVSRRIMFVAMARPDLAERRPGWSGGLRNSSTISLSPLSSEDGEHMIRHLLDDLPAPADAIQPILDRSEGNPFYAQELLRMVIESGSLVRSNGQWLLDRPLPASLPDTVQGVIASRIDMLPVQEKRVLQDAAVIGRIFWPGVLERLGSPAVKATIDALLDKGLVWQRDASVLEGERELIFNHILTRDVAYASIPRSRRAVAHAEALSWIEDKTAGRQEEFAEILAYHAEQAGDLPRTAKYSLLAGHRSRRLFATQEAIQRYDRALQAVRGASGETDHALIAEIALSQGEARELLGQFVDAQADYGRALTEARAASHGLLEARSLAALAHLHWLQDRFDEGEAILSEALDKARSVGDRELLVRLLYTAGTLRFGRGQYGDALPMHQEALRLAQESGDLAGEALARHGLCETRYFLGPLDQALEEGRRADELFRSLGQRPMVYHNLYMVGYVLFFQGRIREALEAFEESVEGCREVGNRRDEGFALGRSLARYPAGELGGALEDMREAVRIAVEIRTPRLELAIRGFGASLLAELRRFDRVEAELDRCFPLAERLGSKFGLPRLMATAGWLALHRGEPERAVELFRQSRERSEDVMLDRIQNGQVELLAWEEAGRPDELRSVAERLGADAARDSPIMSRWADYGLLAASVLSGRFEGVLEKARAVGEWARSAGERMLEWRAAWVGSQALSAEGRLWEAHIEQVRAAGIVKAVAGTLEADEDLTSYLGRPDVSAVLAATGGPLGDLSAEALAELVPPSERRLDDGEAIFRRGDPGSSVYLVARGAVRLVSRGGGEELLVGRMGPYEVFGELGLLDGGPRSADAVAEGPTVVFEFGREPFLRLLKAEPAVAGRMLTLLNERFAEATRGSRRDDNGDLAARLAGAIQQVAGPEDRGGTVIEVLPVFLKNGEIWWLRPSAGTSLQVEGSGSAHPGDAVVSALAEHGVLPVAVHSTSWRFERGRLVVTYLAVLDESDPSVDGFQSAEVRRRDLARGSAFAPPPTIEIDHVVEHALRHLAWLGRDDPVIRELLHGGWFRALESYEPEPFRSLADKAPSEA